MTKAKKVSRQLGELMHAPTHQMTPGKVFINVGQTKDGRAFANGPGIFMSKNNSDAIYAHELAHTIESQNRRVFRLTKDYRAKKTEGESRQSMADLYPDHGYNAHEVTLGEDDWKKMTGSSSRSHYIGKEYGDHEVTEVLSMGVEELFRDPSAFARNDPEYFKLVVGILDGSLL